MEVRSLIDGPCGRIEYVLEPPVGAPRGWAFVGHPHPLYGGTLDNKVAATLARAFVALGWVAVRPNFRGVGGSSGVHDGGKGETEDFLWLIDALPRQAQWHDLAPSAEAIALAGFSFGSFVAAGAARALVAQGRPARALVLVGTAAGKWPVPRVDPATLVIHGEVDETIPLADVLAWARGSDVPVIVLPGADHFFHRRLAQIKSLVVQNLRDLSGEPRLSESAAAGLPNDRDGADE
jgi:alpha/beta superfamily hydrolase